MARVSRDIIYTVVSITVIKLEYENDYENRKRIRAQLRLLNKKKNDERGKIKNISELRVQFPTEKSVPSWCQAGNCAL